MNVRVSRSVQDRRAAFRRRDARAEQVRDASNNTPRATIEAGDRHNGGSTCRDRVESHFGYM